MNNVFITILVISFFVAVPIGLVSLVSKTLRKKLETVGGLFTLLFISSCVGALMTMPEPTPEEKAEKARISAEYEAKRNKSPNRKL